MKSPLRYPGGKQRLAKQIVSMLPEFSEYREPFAGGASVLLSLVESNKQFWLNDLFAPVGLFWTVLRDSPVSLVQEVRKIKNMGANTEFKNHLVSTYDSLSDLERAATFFALNRMTYSGLTFSGGFSRLAWNDRFKDSHITHLLEVTEVLRDVKITTTDYAEVMEEPGSEVVLYLDPPYDIGSCNLYGVSGNLHGSFDHERFARLCKACSHRWLVTYNDSDKVRDLFSWATIREVPVKYSINSTSKSKTELFIKNF